MHAVETLWSWRVVGWQGELSAARAVGIEAEYPVTDACVRHASADRADYAGNLATPPLPEPAGHRAESELPVSWVHAYRSDLDAYLPLDRIGVWDIEEFKHLRATELFELDRPQRRSSWL